MQNVIRRPQRPSNSLDPTFLVPEEIKLASVSPTPAENM
jgi:hypothetical protein